MEKTPKKCPYCDAGIKYPGRRRDDGYTTMTTYDCGTSASIHWSPPVRSKRCVQSQSDKDSRK